MYWTFKKILIELILVYLVIITTKLIIFFLNEIMI